jgi:hypothetical protein
VKYGLGLVVLWLIPAFLFSLQWYFDAAGSGKEVSWWEMFLRSLPRWIVWAPLTPLAIWLARRIDRRARGTRLALLWHILATLALATLATLGWAAAPMMNESKTPYHWMFVILLPVSVVWSAPLYAAIAALTSAFDARLATAKLEKQLAEARLEALHSQLRPHFFFNTLHSIASLIRANRGGDAVSMIARLGELMRETLNEGGARSTVAREMELVRLYLEIQKVRFPDRLTAHFEVEPATLPVTIPALLLQPLVENAIDHGIAQLPDGGEIRIDAHHADEKLVLCVTNTGGLRPAFSEGVGIRNTRQRLAQTYGGRHGFSIDQDGAGRVRVRIEIPW